MLFREFNIIAAAAYAAESAAAAGEGATPVFWDELSEDAQNVQMRLVMAIARGETPIPDNGDVPSQVFVATAAAILGYNNGNGGLALEEIANIGGTVLNLGLMTEAEVGDRNIREVAVALLEELAERRANIHGTVESDALGRGGLTYTDADVRRQALAIAVDRAQRVPGEAAPESIVDGAQVFYDFIVKSGTEPWVRISALQHAAQLVGAGNRASTVVLVAEDFMTFLEPTPAEPQELTETVNNGVEAAAAEPAPETTH